MPSRAYCDGEGLFAHSTHRMPNTCRCVGCVSPAESPRLHLGPTPVNMDATALRVLKRQDSQCLPVQHQAAERLREGGECWARRNLKQSSSLIGFRKIGAKLGGFGNCNVETDCCRNVIRGSYSDDRDHSLVDVWHTWYTIVTLKCPSH